MRTRGLVVFVVKNDNDPGPGRSRSSTDERSVKLVPDALKENRFTTCKEFHKATGAKTSQENAQSKVIMLQN